MPSKIAQAGTCRKYLNKSRLICGIIPDKAQAKPLRFEFLKPKSRHKPKKQRFPSILAKSPTCIQSFFQIEVNRVFSHALPL
jgi:hypothetical protein